MNRGDSQLKRSYIKPKARKKQVTKPAFNKLRDRDYLDLCRLIGCQNPACNSTQAVPAHCNDAWAGKGRGTKASDGIVAALCDACHYEYDQGHRMSREQKEVFFLVAYARTQNQFLIRRLIIVSPAGLDLLKEARAGVPA